MRFASPLCLALAQRVGGGTITTVSPPVRPRWPVAPVSPVLPVFPVAPLAPVMPMAPASPGAPVLPDEPVAPVAPVAPAGPGTVITVGAAAGVRSQALSVKTAKAAANAMEYFMELFLGVMPTLPLARMVAAAEQVSTEGTPAAWRTAWAYKARRSNPKR